MATHTDAQLDRVLDLFEKIGRKLKVIPETRPSSYTPVKIARPGSYVIRNEASQRWAAASAGLLADRGLSLEQIARMSSREVATKLFDAVETITWRAANLQPDDFKRLSSAPLRLWQKRNDLRELPGLLLEKGAGLLMKNGKHPEA
jgi:hypothetical protein